jgi:hypothetical protein
VRRAIICIVSIKIDEVCWHLERECIVVVPWRRFTSRLCVMSEIHGIVSKNTCAPEREKQCRLKGVPGFDAISKQTAENDWS